MFFVQVWSEEEMGNQEQHGLHVTCQVLPDVAPFLRLHWRLQLLADWEDTPACAKYVRKSVEVRKQAWNLGADYQSFSKEFILMKWMEWNILVFVPGIYTRVQEKDRDLFIYSQGLTL